MPAVANLSFSFRTTLTNLYNLMNYNNKILFAHKMSNPGRAQQAGGTEAHTKNLCSNLSTEIVDNWEPETR
ncbi:MAG: hypothetical protein KBG29_10675, partial [Pseudomonadales bacterium]|nr:hypothetical protein [Pseudomonadales bacterium]